MSRNIAISEDGSVVDKRKSSDYGTLRGLVPVELIRRFKVFCVDNNLDNSEGLEKILRDYFESLDDESTQGSNTNHKSKPSTKNPKKPSINDS